MQPLPPVFEEALDGLAGVRDETLKKGNAEAPRKMERFWPRGVGGRAGWNVETGHGITS